MPARAIPCRSCGDPVPRNLAACPACGTVVNPAVDSAKGTPDPASPAVEPGSAAPPSDTTERPGAEAVEAVDPVQDAPAPSIAPASASDGLDAGGIVVAPAIPGAYLSPSAVYQPPPVSQPPVMPLAGTAPPTAPAMSTGADPAPRPGEAPLLADLPFDAPNTLSGWLVAIGSGLAAVSFLLPWAPGIANYTSSWGLSSVANIPVLALLIVTVVLAVLPNRVAIWIRSGVLGMIGGALFLGVLWPYVIGDFGAEFGATVGAVAAIVLAAGGILAVAPRREAPTAG